MSTLTSIKNLSSTKDSDIPNITSLFSILDDLQVDTEEKETEKEDKRKSERQQKIKDLEASLHGNEFPTGMYIFVSNISDSVSATVTNESFESIQFDEISKNVNLNVSFAEKTIKLNKTKYEMTSLLPQYYINIYAEQVTIDSIKTDTNLLTVSIS